MTPASSARSRSSSLRAPVPAAVRRAGRLHRPGARRPLDPVAACGGVEGTAEERRRGRQAKGADGQPPQDRDRRLDVLELAALHRQEGHQGLQQEVRRQVQVRRGDQRQLRVLREGPPAARAGHSRSAATSSRRPTTWPRAWSASTTSSRSTRRTSRTRQHGRQPQVDQLRPRARLLAAVAVGHDRHRLQHQEDRPRAQERQGPLRPEVQGPGDDALRALRLGQHGPARRRRGRLEGRRSTRSSARSRRSTRPTATASSAASPATTTRPTSPRATSGSRSPTRAT